MQGYLKTNVLKIQDNSLKSSSTIIYSYFLLSLVSELRKKHDPLICRMGETTTGHRSTGGCINAVRRRHDTHRVGCADGRDWKSCTTVFHFEDTRAYLSVDTARVTAIRHAYDEASKLDSWQSQRIIWSFN